MSIIASTWTRARTYNHSRVHHLHLHPSLPPSFCVCHHQRIIQRDTLHHRCKKNVAWKSFTISENTTIHLPPSLCSLIAPTLFLFHLLFVSPHFFPSQVFSGAPQMEQCGRKPYPFVLCLPIQLHRHVGILKFRLMQFHCANCAYVSLWFSDNRGCNTEKEHNNGSSLILKKNFKSSKYMLLFFFEELNICSNIYCKLKISAHRRIA